MPYYCTVPRCTSMAGKAKNVSFHQFPRDDELAKLWNKILKRGKPYTKYSKVCSLHFTPEDYTITSVGKNKGQWRTLRKDAIPSQNLPSESPTPYQRKQWSSWTRDTPSNLMEPTIQQQVAQAIYMQTMLAMQTASATDISTLNHNDVPTSTEVLAHTSATPDTDILKGKQTNTHSRSSSFKCTECSKCFKDPDVFMLHKRSHMKKEKENYNLNLTLQANPILANLLKSNTENSNLFDGNFGIESLLMTALAANMEGYIRNFTSMIKGEERGLLHHGSGHLDGERGHLDHDSSQINGERGHSHHDSRVDRERGHSGHDSQMDQEKGLSDHDSREDRERDQSDHDGREDRERDQSDHDGREDRERDQSDHDGQMDQERVHSDHNGRLDRQTSHSDHVSQMDQERGHSDYDSGHFHHSRADISHRGSYELNYKRGSIQDCQSTSQSVLDLKHSDSVMNNESDMSDRSISRGNNVFNNRLIEHYKNNTYDSDRSVRYYENNDSGSQGYTSILGERDEHTIDDEVLTNDDRVMDKGMTAHNIMNRRNGMIDDDGFTNCDDSQSSSDGANCDKDLDDFFD